MEGDGGGDGGLLGAGGEAVGGVFDVAAGDDGAVCEEEGGADAEVAVGGVGVVGDGDGALLEVCDLCGETSWNRANPDSVVVWRHVMLRLSGGGDEGKSWCAND